MGSLVQTRHHSCAAGSTALPRPEMPKDCLMRHINENHLELRHICPICHEQFTRANTMQNHMSRKHSGN
ncbi:hypothetical protein L210DRAFT_3589001 [Boletus edulis BED1]|uniref:C2H2-type domain-containing protein n=1 Tax=Boletus edulis BED1 TaxID=1328754 RepID=A0AAD4B9L7_BOLED|nr:hypothetical protein L210DRAFT_3589001 [Boletus edulis BED1]